MNHFNTYRTSVRIGNWNEDLLLEKEARKEYLEKKERGQLIAQKVDFLKQHILRPVTLTVTNDGMLRFGNVVMLVNMGGEKRESRAVSINADIHGVTKSPSPGIQAPCGVSAGRVQACTRTAFIITSVDGSPEGSTLHYDQCFTLKTTSGFARGLYLTSDLRSFEKCAQMSRLQEVNLDTDASFLSWWRIEHVDPLERLEYEGQPVPANFKVLIKHCKTNQALTVMDQVALWTTYGKEYEVAAHTFLDRQAERDTSHWILRTSESAEHALPSANMALAQANLQRD